VDINHLLAGFILLLKYPYCCICKWLNFTVFNDKNIACPAHVKTYELVSHKWKCFIAAGWRLWTIFKVRGMTYQELWPLGVKLLNLDVEKNAIYTRKSFICSNSNVVTFQGFYFGRNPNKYASCLRFPAPTFV